MSGPIPCFGKRRIQQIHRYYMPGNSFDPVTPGPNVHFTAGDWNCDDRFHWFQKLFR